MKLNSITVHMVSDQDADLSWLDQSDEEMGEGFEDASNQRKIDYHNGEWEMMGVYVTADVTGNGLASITVRSAGLWGIESDSGPEYFEEVAHEQIAEVVNELRAMGISEEEITEEVKYAYRQCAPVVYA